MEEETDNSGRIRFIEITIGSEMYQAELRLREEMLRKPLGLTFPVTDLALESGYRHFGLAGSDGLVACLMCVPLEAGRVQIRQMVVREEFQGRGLGGRLLTETEACLSAAGYHSLVLHARETAIGFYRKLGYQPEGALFEALGIPHQQMEKQLPGQPDEGLS